MNRHLATYEWVGSSPALTYRTPYIFWVMMDIEPHREALFNELYDVEHVPLLLKLPGCVNVVRYRTETPGEPRYLAAYEVDRPDLPMSPAVERHLRHRPLEARGQTIHLQQEVTS